MIRSVKCHGFTLRSTVMKTTFILITFLVLEQVNGKKRVVIHVPNKINNIHHHHVKKVVVYKPVPVKCHHEEHKQDWDGWESQQKDEWVDKRPVKHPGHGWPSAEIIKGGYVSGERISSDSWDAAAAAASMKQLKTPLSEIETHDDEIEEPFSHYPLKRPAANHPWKVWTPSDVIRVTDPPAPASVVPVGKNQNHVKIQSSVVQTPKDQYVTYKVVKKKVTKQRVKKKPMVNLSGENSWSDGESKAQKAQNAAALLDTQEVRLKKSRLKAQYLDQSMKSNLPFNPSNSQLHLPDQDLYSASSSIKPQFYPKAQYSSDPNVKINSNYNSVYSGHSNAQFEPGPNQNAYYTVSTPQPYYEHDSYFTSSIRPAIDLHEIQTPSSQHSKSYYNQNLYSASGGRNVQNEQDSFTFNSQNIKALLDQNVQTSINSNNKRRPNYDVNIHSSDKVKPNSSSYQMRYLHFNNTTPVAFLINHRNINLNNLDQNQT